ncbi:hypothetical protein Lalb_Chr15g0084301 [Lupinus albus]|uniref:Secreted protein n=1 Tax=Lupinus albus TaxID=3870 RepID=A0A6A4PAC2_LUPAL|nr:hypothetical protein Lalb_Chr15g0084301 [Lupinus albus]
MKAKLLWGLPTLLFPWRATLSSRLGVVTEWVCPFLSSLSPRPFPAIVVTGRFVCDIWTVDKGDHGSL